MIGQFRLNINPKQESDSEPSRQQQESWMITEQDLEKNKAKVWHTQKHTLICKTNHKHVTAQLGQLSVRLEKIKPGNWDAFI